ncbi:MULTISPECIES: effector-associated constant component EACC1 [Amycolatopsis]|uniref:Uncharacterized protein n=2 Tax=Amycolatopsis TaxID=1813 RepID=A0A1I4CU64_9PSEU|nr:hypothetical protein [Amycolatopsis sacchari]SFK84303.1 hypothetical protein SAMN05421835_13739 [Amycolatopsis sacchari]
MLGSVEFRCAEAPEELRSLEKWLTPARELRGRTRLGHAAIAEGEMGGALEVLTVGLGSGSALTVLIQSVFSWLERRRAGSTIKLKLKQPDGREADLEIDGAQQPDAIVERVFDFFGERRR